MIFKSVWVSASVPMQVKIGPKIWSFWASTGGAGMLMPRKLAHQFSELQGDCFIPERDHAAAKTPNPKP